jgi:hypothetical protein
VNDNKDQILYITEPASKTVIIVQLKDHHCEECYEDNPTRTDIDPNRYKSQSEMTRRKQRKNHLDVPLEKLLHNTNAHRDQISCDINTQEIQIIKNESDGENGGGGDYIQSMVHSTKEGSKNKKVLDDTCESGEDHGENIIELQDDG